MLHDSRERIRRERERERNTYTSPRLALRRVLLLAEGRQFREAAAILARLGPGVLQTVATELPIDLLIESLPHSAHLLETMLHRLISLEIHPRPDVQVESIAWRLVGLLGGEQAAALRARTARLAAVMPAYAPDARAAVDNRRRQLDAAVHGLGTHGLTADSSGALISLHVAMKNELQRHVDVYKQALHKLEEMSPVTITQDPACSSHQRLLSLSHADVERRLIDNKSLLTIVDKPALRQLPTLVTALAQRVESDKAVLACVGQVKRSEPTLDLSDSRPVAGVLMSYSRGCSALLSQMEGDAEAEGEAAPATLAPRSPTDSASDGYHSDSDDSNHQSEKSKLISEYAGVWALAADAALPALAQLEPLRRVPHLKYKIVFSVVVLAFRAVIALRERKLSELRALLGVDPPGAGAGSGAGAGAEEAGVARAWAAAADVLRRTAHTYPLEGADTTVVNQVVSTLREYPCLSSCSALRSLAAAAVRAAWHIALTNMRIDTDFTPVVVDPEKHVRYSAGEARPRGDVIKSFVWPALLDRGQVVFRAVVLT